LWLAVGIRLLLGWSLVQVAAVSRCPMALTVLGWIAIAAAVALVLVGRERVGRLITWGTARPTWLLRAWCVFGLALGAFIVWAVA
jgi:hypothetical protein